jgi:hypothetical protein
MSLEDFIITVFCLVDDMLKEVVKSTGKLRQRGFASQLDDAEVIAMEIVGEYQGIDTDAGILRYFGQHWRQLFPKLTTRCNFSRQAANLGQVKTMIQQRLVACLRRQDEGFLTDGVPMPVCHLKRSGQSHLFRGEAEYGYCATKEEYYYGFKGLIVTTLSGAIIDYTVGGANLDEREAFIDCAESVRGQHGIGDKGFIGAAYKADLQRDFEVTLHTLLRSNMKDERPQQFLRFIVKTRRLVETVIGQLTERFHLNRVWARNLFRLANRVARKILAHTIAVMILRNMGCDDLQMERLVAVA